MRLFKGMEAVAIDGPAGSGKSTVSRLVAERLRFVYIDTGAMYRALTLKIMRNNVDFTEEDTIVKFSEDIDLKFVPPDLSEGPLRIMMDGEDVSSQIRRMEVTTNVKHVARLGRVRENLVRLQRQMVAGIKGAVMEGRDITTVVLPNAKHKFYVDASFDERVRRRYEELQAGCSLVTLREVSDDLKQRDHADKTRKIGPLKKADDAVYIDTTKMAIDEVVDKIVKYVKGGSSEI
ncbi:MAG: (d)CMP kinase [Candidatus Omnitrophota bacterium]